MFRSGAAPYRTAYLKTRRESMSVPYRHRCRSMWGKPLASSSDPQLVRPSGGRCPVSVILLAIIHSALYLAWLFRGNRADHQPRRTRAASLDRYRHKAQGRVRARRRALHLEFARIDFVLLGRFLLPLRGIVLHLHSHCPGTPRRTLLAAAWLADSGDLEPVSGGRLCIRL